MASTERDARNLADIKAAFRGMMLDLVEIIGRTEQANQSDKEALVTQAKRIAEGMSAKPARIDSLAAVEGQGQEMLSGPDLATRFKVNPEALRKRLERWMRTHQNNWVEVTERGPREPKYLYRVSAVLPIIRELQESGESSGN